MNEHKIINIRLWQYGGKLLAATLGVALITAPPLQAAEAAKAEPAATAPAKQPAKQPAKAAAKKPAKSSAAAEKSARPIPTATELAPYLELSVGESQRIRLPDAMTSLEKVTVDNPNVAQVTVNSLREVLLHGKSAGSAVLTLKGKSGQTTVVDVTVVSGGGAGLQRKLQQLLKDEKNIKVESAGATAVLTGTVSDAVKAERAVTLAEAYSGKKVINFLKVSAPQQVMLEVKVAEVSKTLTDKLGAQFNWGTTSGRLTYGLLANFLTGAGGVAGPAAITITSAAGKKLTLDAAKTDGLVKILAEPTIMAMSGQEGAFLAGGRIYIPVPQAGVGGVTITLEEKEFGVGLKFTPVVLEGGLINLKVSPEVSELGKGVTVGTQVLPSITTRRAATTVQLHDGQSFAIGGLIKNNITETISAFPGLGEIPILGALFRSSEFVNDRSELLFVITPRLVKPLPPDYALPTDGFIEPTRGEFFLQGKLEGSPKAEAPAASAAEPTKEPAPAQAPAAGGFQMK